jgi:hypothetical protein
MHNFVANPMMNSNLMKNINFPMFISTKNTRLNQFNPISKRAKFKVLHATPNENEGE